MGNAQPDLQKWVQERLASEAQATGPGGKQRLLMTQAAEARGILEGLAHWGYQ